LKAPDAVRARLVSEAREFFGVSRAILLPVAGREGRVQTLAMSPTAAQPRGPLAVAQFPVLQSLLESGDGAFVTSGDEAERLDRALGSQTPAQTVLLLPMRSSEAVRHVLVLADRERRPFESGEVEVAAVFAAAASASLAQTHLAEEHAAHIAQQAALARAAKTLNESLDLNRVLVRICHEAASILDADNAVVYRGGSSDGVVVEATYGMPPEAVGYRMQPGMGLAGRVAELDRSLITNDYQGMPRAPDKTLFGEIGSSIGVPMHWDEELRGVLAVGYKRSHLVTREHLSLLEAFGEIAAAACRNASAHAGLAHAARTDGLTGCLNHAAMHDAVRREIERCERTGHRLSLVLVDMDDFKQVNEEHGHLMGDEVLRRVGHALRQSVRPYDLVARYGGDEFAILAVESDEPHAVELSRRSLECVTRSLEELGEARSAGGASAGVAEWAPGESATGLIERSDRALLYGKQEREPGSVVATSELPREFRPSDLSRRDPAPAPPSAAAAGNWPAGAGREQTERLRKRTRQLALANALGTRLAAMTDPQEIIEAAVDELHRAFGFYLCAVIRVRDDGYVHSAAGRGEAFLRLGEQRWAQPRSAGLIGRCLRERCPIIAEDVSEMTDYRMTAETQDVRSELVVPLWVGEELWGVVTVQERLPDAFDEDDARLVQTVADQIGSALRSAMLYERLEGAYLGTAEALAAALEAKDSYTASHSRAVVGRTQEVGRRLGMAEPDLQTLRFAAIFHDIGKIAVPEAILNKRGPLNSHEREEVERHTVVGERILSTVDFLKEVLPLVRHEHERWDGHGYPDGLSGEDIPLGSRIILACDAYDAMTTDRPYRAA
ncbi:MAG: GAF domain-containing protein, partial [Thermoleophilaceae bacterium]|nr:GAF domain-containing protein [Thermoleophilaceae bacterium]